MKVLTVLETIQEGVALQGPSRFPSYLGTPRRIVTPAPSPKPVRYQNQNQNLMSGVRSPDILSRMSLQSCRDSEVSGNHLSVPYGGGANNVFLRATEKLGSWLIHHSSRVDLNPNPTLNGATSFTGLLSRQVSSIAMNDRDELEPSESVRNIVDDAILVSPRGIALSPPRLSPVAEMFCSKSTPANSDVHMTQGSNIDLHQLAIVSQTNRQLADDRFCVTPIPNRYSRQCSQESGKAMSKEEAGDNCFQINIEEPYADGEMPDSLDNQTDHRFQTTRVRWSDNLEQITRQQVGLSGSNSLTRNEKNLQYFDYLNNDNAKSTNLNDLDNVDACSRNVCENLSCLNEHFTAQPIPSFQFTSVNMDSVEDAPPTSASTVHHNGSDSSFEYEPPETHQCTVNSLTPLLGDMTDEEENKGKC